MRHVATTQGRSDAEYEDKQHRDLRIAAERAFGDLTMVSLREWVGGYIASVLIFNSTSKHWVEIYCGTIEEAFDWLEKGGM